MKKIKILLFLTLLTSVVWSQPRPARLSGTIVIDTDCGIDDFRAISLLLDRPEITIKAILTCDGSLPPFSGAEKVLSLLHEFGKDSIPVASGEIIKGVNPPWRDFNNNIIWGKQAGKSAIISDAAGFLGNLLKSENERISLVCLGPLTSTARLVRENPGVLGKIERIIWYNDSLKPLKGFNYECDRESAETVLNSGVRIDVISNLGLRNASFDTLIVKTCVNSDSRLANVLSYVFSRKESYEKLKEDHFKLYDDLVALYLTNPELFDINTDIDKLNIRYCNNYDVDGVREAMEDMIKGTYVSDHNVVFNSFPVQRELFDYDIRPIIDSAIARYGYEEWKANVMTDEFHGHLGVFSIVGAKMGIKARELFGVGPDMLEVTSDAGFKPPYSCLNDGIQVSTGATTGMGTIHVAATRKAQPSAVFTYNNRSIKLSLKKQYLDKVDSDIREGISKFGLMDDGYWKLIRRNAIRYWIDWDRNKIFDIEEVKVRK